MPASRNQGSSALRTGLSHFAISVVTFGTLSAGAAGAVHFFGDADASAPITEIALFSADAAGAPPPLKTRLENSFGRNSGSVEPSLPGVEYNDAAFETTMADAAPPAGFKVIEIGASPGLPATPQPLAKAPIEGLHERTPAGNLPRIADDGRTPAQAYARPFVPDGSPRISLMVGGLGLNRNHTLAAINELPPEVTLSFVPYAADLQTWVNRARAAGHEVLLELPMEPYDYRNVDTGPQTLLTTLSPQENTRRLNLLLGKATGYFGVTNYQGAKFATDAKAAEPVMAALEERGLAFVHDGGAARSALPEAANKSKVGFAVANRIVDTEPSADAIDRELLQLEALAIQNGHALGVGYAYPVTIEQLRIWAIGLKAKGYQLAPASATGGLLQ